MKDYANLLHLFGEYEIYELEVKKDDWMSGKKLGELNLWSEGVNVLAIKKPIGDYVEVPNRDSKIEANDHLILYGREESLSDLDERKKGKKGEEKHEEAKEKQRRQEHKEKKEKQERKRG
ncbi:MAG: TrkA C-terminal domain-containing protein [Candidatus Cyclobacteriaceae bacterium M2_1C_046]